MKSQSLSPPILLLLLLPLFVVLSTATNYDFYYFVETWPGSYCDTKEGCCYPSGEKPPGDFIIGGLWPYYKDGSYPSYCNPNSPYESSKIKDLKKSLQSKWPNLDCSSGDNSKLWKHEWEEHGTCSDYDQYSYFEKALKLKKALDLYKYLGDQGYKPNGKYYSLSGIKDAIKSKTGYTPGVVCNRDGSGNSQLYQIYICVHSSGKQLIKCPVFPKGGCEQKIKYPSF